MITVVLPSRRECTHRFKKKKNDYEKLPSLVIIWVIICVPNKKMVQIGTILIAFGIFSAAINKPVILCKTTTFKL